MTGKKRTAVMSLLPLLMLWAALTLPGGLHAGTRVFTDAAGKNVNVPSHPGRVAVVDELDLDAMLALGIKPWATTMARGQDRAARYLGDRRNGIEIIGAFFRPNIELLVKGEPDLILAGGLPHPVLLSHLGAVAPTAVTYTLGEDWQTAFARVADLFDARDRASAFMADYRQRADTLKAALANRGLGTVSIVRWNPKGPAFMQNDAFAVRVLADIGLRRPAQQDEPGIAHSKIISLENLHLIDAQIIFLGTLSDRGEAVTAMKRALETPAFRELTAVKNGRVIPVDGSLWTSLGGPLAALRILDDVERLLLEKASRQ